MAHLSDLNRFPVGNNRTVGSGQDDHALGRGTSEHHFGCHFDCELIKISLE